MGIATVAVYSDADAHSLHVAARRRAFRIGPRRQRQLPARRSDRRGGDELGCFGHPPGLRLPLGERGIRRALRGAGIAFVGRRAGDPRHGRQIRGESIMEKAGVPLVPAITAAISLPTSFSIKPCAIGFPVLIKAAAGGGGKGMRAVEHKAEFDAALAACRREACPLSVTSACCWKNTSSAPGISRSRCSPTGTAAVSRFLSATARFSAPPKVLEEAPAPHDRKTRRAR